MNNLELRVRNAYVHFIGSLYGTGQQAGSEGRWLFFFCLRYLRNVCCLAIAR